MVEIEFMNIFLIPATEITEVSQVIIVGVVGRIGKICVILN